jgi:hypothetical protein
MALPQNKVNRDDGLEQADVTRELLDWLDRGARLGRHLRRAGKLRASTSRHP